MSENLFQDIKWAQTDHVQSSLLLPASTPWDHYLGDCSAVLATACGLWLGAGLGQQCAQQVWLYLTTWIFLWIPFWKKYLVKKSSILLKYFVCCAHLYVDLHMFQVCIELFWPRVCFSALSNNDAVLKWKCDMFSQQYICILHYVHM